MAVPAKPPTTYREQVRLLRKSKRFLRLLAYLFLIYLLTPFLLGFAFALMLLPLTFAFVCLAVVFTAAYHILGRMLGVEGLPAKLAKPPTWLTIYSAAVVLFHLGLVAISLRLLFLLGFCHQNLVCLFAPFVLKR